MSAELTRRQLGRIVTGVAVAAIAGSTAVSLAVHAAPPTPALAQNWDQAARDSHRENSQALAKFEIPMSLEPALQFKA